MANNSVDPFADMRRRMEELFGYPPGAFAMDRALEEMGQHIPDPASNVLRDVERINRALGRGFVQLQEILGPQALLDRFEDSFTAAREVLELPLRMKPKIWPDGVWRRRE